ncbi:MAG: hypothetical protein M1832_002739 [Thelocarpon impressellum]|nr:MAG: hypothetical protein M1832_002739 [Thelocarpon impressellum]
MPPSVALHQQRPNPRRTRRCSSSSSTSASASGSGSSCSAPPPCPSLVRQSDRKVNFVDNLVDSAAQIVEVIWPLSVVACRGDASLGGKAVLPLRTFIQETLRRSRTSYSTLQVALYYLIVVKPHVPGRDFTMEQPADDGAGLGGRSLQCGRRMFLAALILASKYLQDRNYSARAWSKISGLDTLEVNANESAFLAAVGWRLHISEPVFQRWTDIVLRYTSSAPPPPSPTSSPLGLDRARPGWAAIIPTLTAQLDTVDVGLSCAGRAAAKPPRADLDAATYAAASDMPSPPPEGGDDCRAPTDVYNIARVLKPRARTCAASSALPPRLPPLARMGPLPTPRMTPRTHGFDGPAVAVVSAACSRRSSIGSALAQADGACNARTTLDRFPPAPARLGCGSAVGNPLAFVPLLQHGQRAGSRRFSRGRSASSNSSPESMVSDTSSTSSRSSSISSASSSYCAPNPASLAVQATCRSARLPRRGRKDDSGCPASALAAEEVTITARGHLSSSPESYAGFVPDLRNFSLSTPRESGTAMAYRDAAKEAAHDLGGLVADRHRPAAQASAADSRRGRKRGRTSEDMSALQRHVRKLVAGGDAPAAQVAVDGSLQENRSPTAAGAAGSDVRALQSPTGPSPPRMPVLKDASTKRACCGNEAALPLGERRPGPGMWEGIL